MLSSHLNYRVESVFCLVVNKRLWNIWHWILHCETILIWKSITTKFFTEFSLVQYWMFLFLKRSHVTWHVGFVLGFFFPNWKKLRWPLHRSRSSSHLCWMCSWQERGELVTVLLGHWQGTGGVGSTSDAGWDSLLSNPRNLVEEKDDASPIPAQPSVCALFAVSPDNCEPTAAPPGSPGVCLGRRNSNPGESCGNSIKWVVSAKVSCELLWFECGFVNPFPSRRFGRCGSLRLHEVKILMVNFEKLVCVFGLKCEQDAEHAPGMGTVSCSHWPHL